MKAIDRRRINHHNSEKDNGGPVVYWMSREQRVRDNWGLLHARSLAGETRPLIVLFCLAPSFIGATLRHYDFMLKGLKQVEASLAAAGIPFVLRMGNPELEVPEFVRDINAGVVVTDFDPLRIKKIWQETVCCNVDIPLIEVDGHNVVPARIVSNKQEYAARTIRPKIQRLLPEFLTDFPDLAPLKNNPLKFPKVDWEEVFGSIDVDTGVKPVDLVPGEEAGLKALDGFIAERLGIYAERRNDPNSGAVSGLSPYFHFGQLAPQRAAFNVLNSGVGENQESYLEELIIRRELSDNFCLYNNKYDSLEGAPEWARKTLEDYSGDMREYVYTYEEFEQARTHSSLWNAAQRQLLTTGRIHGYMRMYWAKKILEWSESPSEALRIGIELNDRFAMDGRDPNGYVGVMWSVAGLHDRAWKKRPVFGSIRYMNENGCRRKFDVDSYIARWVSGISSGSLLDFE